MKVPSRYVLAQVGNETKTKAKQLPSFHLNVPSQHSNPYQNKQNQNHVPKPIRTEPIHHAPPSRRERLRGRSSRPATCDPFRSRASLPPDPRPPVATNLGTSSGDRQTIPRLFQLTWKAEDSFWRSRPWRSCYFAGRQPLDGFAGDPTRGARWFGAGWVGGGPETFIPLSQTEGANGSTRFTHARKSLPDKNP